MNEQAAAETGTGTGLELDRALEVVPSVAGQDAFVGAGRDYGPLRIYGGASARPGAHRRVRHGSRRTSCLGHVFDRGGRLLASVAQEAMMRRL